MAICVTQYPLSDGSLNFFLASGGCCIASCNASGGHFYCGEAINGRFIFGFATLHLIFLDISRAIQISEAMTSVLQPCCGSDVWMCRRLLQVHGALLGTVRRVMSGRLWGILASENRLSCRICVTIVKCTFSWVPCMIIVSWHASQTW